MAIELAKAYLPIIPSLGRGFKANLEKEIGGAVEQAADNAGSGFGERLFKGLKVGAVAVGTAAGGLLATSLVKGFGRLSAIENAEKKLEGLGHTTEGVAAIMDSALASVKGTAFGLDEAATTASAAVAAGVEPGKELTRYLGLVGDAATIAGTDMASMGSIFNKVMTSGKVQGDVFAQLSDAGIPVVQMLAKEMGITAEEVYKLGSEGKISSDTFIEAMSSMEGAALKGGETTAGAYKNTMAALSRFGAKVLEDIFPLIGPALNQVTSWLDQATNAVGPFMDEVVGGFRAFGAAWAANDGDITSSGFPGFMEQVAYWLRQGYELTVSWAPVLAPFAAGVVGIAAAFGVYRLALQATAIAQGIMTAVTGAWQIATGVQTGTLWGLTAAQWAALAPIALAVGAIAALTAGVVLAYNNVGWFRDLVDSAWANIQAAIGVVVDWWSGTAWPAIQSGLATLGQWFTWLWQNVVVPAWAAISQAIQDAWVTYIQPALQAVWSFIQGTLAPIFVWLWQNVVTPVFSGVVAVISWAWNTVILPLFQLVVWVIQTILAPVFTWLWNNIITPVWNGIVLAIKVAWAAIEIVFGLLLGFLKNILGPAFTWFWDSVISPVWSWISDKISAVGGFIVDTIFPKLRGALDVLKTAFEKTKDGIGTAWETLRSLVSEPVKFVVNTVINDGIIAGYNKLNDFWSGKDLARIELPAGFRKGGFTGNYGLNEVAGVVHGREFVTRAEATERVNREHPGFLETLNRTGSVMGALGAAAGPARSHSGYCAHCSGAAAMGAAVSHSTSASTAGAPPSGGNGGIWGAFQSQIARAGKLYVPKMNFMGVNTENVARAWIGRSAVEIIPGSGNGPSVSFASGGQGTWGFNAGSQIWMQPGVPQNMREAVLIHELGHALSLHHTMNTGSIMHPLMQGPTWPSALDYGSLVRAWGAPGEGVKTYDGGGGGIFSMLADKAEEMITNAVRSLADGARAKFLPNRFVDMPIGVAEKTAIDVVKKATSFFGGADGAAGGLVPPALYDKGGLITRGVQLIDHQRSTPDYVLTDQQWNAMYEIAQSTASAQQGQPAIQIGSVHGYTAEEVAAQIEKERRQKMALAL